MNRKKLTSQTLSSYHLSPRQLEDLHKKFGRPGEMSPGVPAPKKRSRLDTALAAMDRRSAVLMENEDQPDTDIT